jgi:hypothetical protein
MAKKYNLLITGYYFKKNYGDDLLLSVAKKLFSSKYCSAEFSTQVVAIDAIHQNNMHELCSWSDKIVLFGGEVLNDYFIDKLNAMKSFALEKLRKNIGLYAIGVSCNADYAYITNKLDIFEVIIFRNQADSKMFIPRFSNLYCKALPDPVFLLKPTNKPNFLTKLSSKKEKNINVAFFLSQTVKPTDEYLEKLAHLVRNWIFHNATVYLLTMCNNTTSSTENDLLINTAVYDNLNYAERANVIYIDKPESILNILPSIDYGVCWRFHAHIFCIQYAIPFISISNTPKVINLLNDNALGELCFYNKNAVMGISYVIENRESIKKKLDDIHTALLKSAQDYKKWPNYIFRERHLPRFYLDVSKPNMIINIKKMYDKYVIENDHDFNAKMLIYLLTGKMNSEYQWGLMKKMEQYGGGLNQIENEIKWLIAEQIKEGNPAFFYKMAAYFEIDGCLFEKQQGKFLNIHFIDQNDMRGVHRAGWQYVIDGIERELATFHPAATLCDLYLDRTFHWNYEANTRLNIIPYTRSWIGFIHHTAHINYSNYNVIEMFKKENFIKSLSHCRALIVLSSYLKNHIQLILKKMGITSIPVFQLFHPTEFVDDSKCFDYNKFITQPTKRIVQVGAWMREIDAIFKFSLGNNPLKYHRYALKGPNMESYYKEKAQSKEQISRDKIVRFEGSIKSIAFALERPVEILEKLSADDYDDLFRSSIIFIKLIDASAVNTIIESIVRNTPILVNPLEAVVEYLGKDYPFYYRSFEEATAKANDQYIIRKTYFYLKKLDKSHLRLDAFIQSFRSLKIFHYISK